MVALALKCLLGLTFVGIIWTVSGDRSVGDRSVGDRSVGDRSIGDRSIGEKSVGQTSVNSSASSVNKTARAGRPKRSSGKAIKTTQDMRKEWLKTHNDVRSDMAGYLNHPQPKATGMIRMYWNAYLEATATAWSVHCCDDWKHGQSEIVKQEVFKKPMKRYGDFIGQNIQYYTGDRMTPTQITKAYAGETTEFDYDTLACKSLCGHYTQIVWNTTFLVGCGYAKCDTKYGITSTCNYLPGGNNGNKPYAAGEPCTSCNGFAAKIADVPKCEGNLCQPSDKCSLVKECKVTDQENCLCDASEYDRMVETLMAGTGANLAGPPLIVYGLLLPLVAILLSHGVQLGYDDPGLRQQQL